MDYLMRRLLIISAIFIFCPLAWAENPKILRLDLNTVFKIAQERNIDMILADERVEQAISLLGQNASNFYPQLNGSISGFRKTRDLRSSGITFSGQGPKVGPFNNFDARLQISQTLFDPVTIARFHAASMNHELTVVEREKIKQDILVLAATLFIDYQRAFQTQQLTKILLDRDAKKNEVARHKFQSGLATDLESQQAQDTYEKSLLNFQHAQTEALTKKLDLLAILGIDDNQSIEFVDDNACTLKNPLDSKISESHVDIKLAQQQVELDKKKSIIEESGYWPKVSALADYGPNGESFDNSSETYSVGVEASVPIFEGGNRQARLDEARSRIRASNAVLNDERNQVHLKIKKSEKLLEQAEMDLKEAGNKLNLARKDLAIMVNQLRQGTASEEDLIEKRAYEAEVKDNFDEAKSNLLLAKINLLRALGKMDEILELCKETLEKK